jgi:tetratricopeptide (TPR) repeat protein
MKRLVVVNVLCVFIIVGCNNSQPKKDKYLNQILIADSLYRNGDYIHAVNYYDKLIKIEKSPIYFYRRGYCKAQTNDFSGSINDYQKSIDFGYKLSDSYFNMGTCYSILNKDSLAIICLKKALDFNPKMKKAENMFHFCKNRNNNY